MGLPFLVYLWCPPWFRTLSPSQMLYNSRDPTAKEEHEAARSQSIL
jgi:hypothetical protein